MSKIIDTIKNVKNLKQKTKLILILLAEFVAITVVLLLIFFAGKQTHTVTFDLNGGTLLSGSEVQVVTQGQHATPPMVAKYGHYLKGWSGSFRSVTRDVTVKAIWEYETTPGIEYYFPEHTNYCEISGSFKELQGEVFIGSFYEERQVLGIQAGAFKDRTGITGIYMLDGILAIEEEAFAGCTSLEAVDIPSTVVRIGKGAFRGCENLKELVLPKSLQIIEEGAFEGCSSIEKIVFPENLKIISDYAFANCSSLSSIEFWRYEEPKEEPEDNKPGIWPSQSNKEEESTEPEKIPTGTQILGKHVFFGCNALTQVVIPETIIEIGENTFSTAKMTIMLYISKDKLPSGYAEGWCRSDSTLIYDYIPEPKEEEETENKNNSIWGDGT